MWLLAYGLSPMAIRRLYFFTRVFAQRIILFSYFPFVHSNIFKELFALLIHRSASLLYLFKPKLKCQPFCLLFALNPLVFSGCKDNAFNF